MPDLRTLLNGIKLGESPQWHDGRLWFSDWGAREIIAVDNAGNSEVMVRDAPELPFSIDWQSNERLLVVAGRDACRLRCGHNGSLSTHTDLSSLATTPWNEIEVDGRGNIYLNNAGFDFQGGKFGPGFVALIPPNGVVQRVADGLAFPNSMAVSPDNSTLIVAESYAARLTAFDIAEDGSLANRRVWAEIKGSAPDGICLDAEGAVWYADVPNQQCVRVREGGEILQTIKADRGCFTCALGGDQGRTLFILAADWHGPASLVNDDRSGLLLTTSAPAPGVGWP